MKDQSLYEKILNKPKAYRRRLSYAITAILGVFIFTIWIIITTFSMKEVFNFENDENESLEILPNETSAPSFYEKEDMQSLEDNFNTLMRQQKE
jgi:hypothetical protein